MQYNKHPHRRKNPLTGEWVLVSPHRLSRPWQGQSEAPLAFENASYDKSCYLCPGNQRANGQMNPDYKGTFSFTNDYAALLPESTDFFEDDPLFSVQSARGTAKVICFSENHALSMASMEEHQIQSVISLWSDEVEALSSEYRWVQVFENKGAIMGCSNPHPHGQIWACDFLPTEGEKEDQKQKEYYERYQSNLLLDYIERELALQSRVVSENDSWVVVVPFWAVWPFETMLLPKKQISHLNYLDGKYQQDLASILKILLTKYDKLFNTSFPYSMGWHGAPFAKDIPYWQLHAHFYPPLLRSESVKKFMVGFEMLGESQRDLTPEYVATVLQEL